MKSDKPLVGQIANLSYLLAVVFLSTFALAASPPSPGETTLARQDTTVRIEPALSVVRTGQTMDVSVTIDEASDLGAFEFTLFFTTTVTVDNVTLGDFLGSTGRTTVPISPTIDNQMGVASFAVATVGSQPGPSGLGVLATVTLTGQGAGESFLDLNGVTVLDTKAAPQATIVEDGVVQIKSAVYLPLILKAW